MKPIDFSREDREALKNRLAAYLAEEFDVEVGGLQADLMLDFLAHEIAPAVYNQALLDAKALVSARLDDVLESLHSLER